MPDINVTFLEDDDALTAAALEGRLTTVEAGVNGLMEYAAREGALNNNHVDTLVIEIGIKDSATPARGTLYISGAGLHTYTIVYTGWSGVPPHPTNGATDRQIIGTGLPLIGGYDLDDQLQFDISPGILLGMVRADRIVGILVLMNVEFETFTEDLFNVSACMTCIQFLSGGTWFTIPRTERFMERRVSNAFGVPPGPGNDPDVNQDIPTRCLILPADLVAEGLDPDTATVEGVRGMVAVAPIPVAAGGGTDSITLGACQMTLVPLHAEKVP